MKRFYIYGGLMISSLAAGLTHNGLAIAAAVLLLVLAVIFEIHISDRLKLHRIILPLLIVSSMFLYGCWTDGSNRTLLPDLFDGREVTIQGKIISPVQVDGDRVSFQLHADRLRLSALELDHLLDDRVLPLIDPVQHLTFGRSSAEGDQHLIFGGSTTDSVQHLTAGSQTLTESDPYQTSVDQSAIDIVLDERIQIALYLDSEQEQKIAKDWYRGIELRFRGELREPGTARNFGDFDYREYLRKQRIHWQVTVSGMQTVEIKSRPSLGLPLVLGYVDQFRDRLSDIVWGMYDPRYAGFMQGLLIGDQSGIPQELYRHFSDIGMTHVLAISGLHVGVFSAGCFWLLRLFRFTRERTYAVCLVLVPLYVLGTGASPSAVRAGLMAMLGLVALRMGRWKDSLRFIMLAALMMLLWNPYFLYNISFQLSFIVTLGLILLAPRISAALPIRWQALSSAIAVTIAAQLYSFPLVIYYFHILHIFSPLANLLLVPLVSVLILPLGMLSLLLGAWHPAIGQMPATVASLVTEGLLRAVEWTASVDSLLLTWSRVPLWWLAAYYGLVTVLFVWLPSVGQLLGPRLSRLPFLVGSASLLALLLYAYAGDHWERTGIVSVLDVGQGDSILIRTPHGRHILVDGGGTFNYRQQEAWRARRDPYEVGKDTLLPLLRRRGIHRLDAVIATHHDADHIGGLHAVIERLPVDRILFNGTIRDSAYFDRLWEAATNRGVPMIPVSAGLEWQIDPATKLLFLHPIRTPGSETDLLKVQDQNASSLVFLLLMHDSTFLLTGDIGAAEEQKVIRYLMNAEKTSITTATPRSVDVLKIAHHGSRHSTSDIWLRYWRPTVGAISVGRNSYGHPAQDVLERLSKHDVETYRTDQHGEIQHMATSNGLYLRTKLRLD